MRSERGQYQYDAGNSKHSAKCTMVREEVDACQRDYSQSKYAAVDSINREGVQHTVCTSGRTSVNRAMASGNVWHERTSELEYDFLRGCKPFQ